MRNDLFYNSVKENERNKPVIDRFSQFSKDNPDTQIFLITAPRGGRYRYPYEDGAIIMLVPGHRIAFINLGDDGNEFENYVNDVVTDLNTISTTYRYITELLGPFVSSHVVP